jgi:DNA-binding transcriptional MerR regulator
MNQRQAARYLGVALRTLQRWHEVGTAPPSIKLPSGARRYRKVDLDAWIEAHKEDS